MHRWSVLARTAGRSLPAVLQVDSGMARLGLAPPELDRLRSDRLLEGVDLRFIASHLACADDASHPANAAQREHFLAAAALFPDVPRTRSEERRVGKEWFSTGRSRWSPYH